MNFDFSPLFISLKSALLGTSITFVLGLIIAYWMSNYNGKLKSIIDSILTIPLVLPPTVLGFILLVIFGKRGRFGGFLDSIGHSPIFTWKAAAIAATVVSFPLMYRTSKGAFEQVDLDVINAARTLGVSEWNIFLQVSIPMAWPGIAAGTVLALARALGEFGATLMIAGNIPKKTQTIPTAIYFASQSGNMKVAWIWVAVIFILSFVFIMLVNYWGDNNASSVRRES